MKQGSLPSGVTLTCTHSTWMGYTSREENEHEKKIAKLPKRIKLPNGSWAYLK